MKNSNGRLRLDRRELLALAPLGLAALWFGSSAAGCGDARSDGDALGAGDGPSVQEPPVLPTCGEHTAPNIEGPFFSPGSPERTVLAGRDTPGVRLRLTGRVTSVDCQPLAGALLDFWQANDAGAYDNVGFEFRGYQLTGEDGAYVLETILPGHYKNGATYRPAHLHVKLAAAGHLLLTTQLYFEGDPYNEHDPFIHPSLVMPVADDALGVAHASFDFVLAPI